jgi:hypothetical protein
MQMYQTILHEQVTCCSVEALNLYLDSNLFEYQMGHRQFQLTFIWLSSASQAQNVIDGVPSPSHTYVLEFSACVNNFNVIIRGFMNSNFEGISV